MTLTDDTLVRQLVDLSDRTLPAMSLTPTTVLDVGRRHRRRRTVHGAVVGALAVAAVAVAAVQLGTGPGPVTAPAAQTVELVDGLTATVPTEPTAVQTSLGPGVDLGLPADEEHSYVVMRNEGGIEVRLVDPRGDMAEESYLSGGHTLSFHYADTAGDATTLLGQVPADTEVTLISSPGDGSAPLTVPIVTAQVPDLPGAVYMLRIDGAPRDGRWPQLSLELRSPDGTTTSQPIDLPEGQAMQALTLEVTVATDVREADSTAGPVLDLGVPVLDGFARQMADGREEMSYALLATTWDEAIGDATLREAGDVADTVTVAGLRPFGALTPMRSSRVTEAGVELNGGPVLAAASSATDVSVLGQLPDGSTGATLVVQRASGDERTQLPTFTVPGLPAEAAFFFFTLHDDVEEVGQAPATIELAAADGTVTLWSVAGDPLNPRD